MSDDFDTDDELSCPHCNHSPVHSRRCNDCAGEGSIDESDEDYCKEGTVIIVCNECHGTGIERWCPNCGANLSAEHFEDDEDNN